MNVLDVLGAQRACGEDLHDIRAHLEHAPDLRGRERRGNGEKAIRLADAKDLLGKADWGESKTSACLDRSVGSRRRDDSPGTHENLIAKLFDDFLDDLSRPGGVHRNLDGSELGPDHALHDASDLLVVVSTENNRHFRKLGKTHVYHAFPPSSV